MNKTSHVHISETVTRRVAATKARKGGRPRKNNTHKHTAHNKHGHKNGTPQSKSGTVYQEPPADDGRAIRAKGLLAATLRVWELKHRISE